MAVKTRPTRFSRLLRVARHHHFKKIPPPPSNDPILFISPFVPWNVIPFYSILRFCASFLLSLSSTTARKGKTFTRVPRNFSFLPFLFFFFFVSKLAAKRIISDAIKLILVALTTQIIGYCIKRNGDILSADLNHDWHCCQFLRRSRLSWKNWFWERGKKKKRIIVFINDWNVSKRYRYRGRGGDRGISSPDRSKI